ncbi:MAG: hypothetical protein ACLTBV_16050 [Enterocloster bolteae]
METAMELLKELAAYAGAFSREKIDAAELVIGMKCGGSDGLSGITANPVVGAFSDIADEQGRNHHPHGGAGDVRGGDTSR